MKDKVYDYLIKNHCYENFYYTDIRLAQPNGFSKTTTKEYELVLFGLKKIIFFVEVPENIIDKEAATFLRTALNFIANRLSVSLNDFLVCGVNDENMYFLNTYNNRLTKLLLNDLNFEKAITYIENEFSYGVDVFDYSLVKKLSDDLSFSSAPSSSKNSNMKIMTTAEGVTYVKKHGLWFEASDYNTEQVFLLAVFAGMFGAHMFHVKKRLKGLLYLCTYGCCGIGWFFDSLAILLGIYKDPDGKYLLPLENKWAGLLMFLAGGVVFCLLGAVVMFLMKFILQGASDILTKFILSFGV